MRCRPQRRLLQLVTLVALGGALAHEYEAESPIAYAGSQVVILLPRQGSTVFTNVGVMLGVWNPSNSVLNVVPQHHWMLHVTVSTVDREPLGTRLCVRACNSLECG